MLLEKTLESPLHCKEIQPDHPKGNQSWIFIGRTDAEVEAPKLWLPDAKKMTHWKRPWCWQRLKAGGEGDNRGWDGWMASPTQWTWVWASCRSWWWTGSPGVLQSMGSQEVGHDLLVNGTELNLRWSIFSYIYQRTEIDLYISNEILFVHFPNPEILEREGNQGAESWVFVPLLGLAQAACIFFIRPVKVRNRIFNGKPQVNMLFQFTCESWSTLRSTKTAVKFTFKCL